MTYIYLNIYSNGYMYVGSHSWSGEGIDPSYNGSSHVAKCYNWVPSSIKILEILTDERKFVAEREWILFYCNKYGIAPPAVQRSHNNWYKKFKYPGLMLNLHSNSAEMVQNEIVQNKVRETRRIRGIDKKFQKAGTIAASSKESRLKSVETKRAKGILLKSVQKAIANAHTPEARLKAVETAKKNGFQDSVIQSMMEGHTIDSFQKGVETRRNNGTLVHSSESYRRAASKKLRKYTDSINYGRKHLVRCYLDNALISEGSLLSVCKSIGHPGWCSSIQQKSVRLNSSVVTHYEYKFEFIF